jgi:hypothetical protein
MSAFWAGRTMLQMSVSDVKVAIAVTGRRVTSQPGVCRARLDRKGQTPLDQ